MSLAGSFAGMSLRAAVAVVTAWRARVMLSCSVGMAAFSVAASASAPAAGPAAGSVNRGSAGACCPRPPPEAALKCLYLAIRSLDPTGRGRKRWTNRWKAALNAFDITFDGRLSAGRK